MSTYENNSWVWVPDPVDCFTPARVVKDFSAGESGKVLTEDGEDRVLTPQETKDLARLNEEVLDAKIDNLINFNELTENALLHNLRIRYKRDLIYTYVSSILISVNPFKLLPIYTPEILDSYRKGGARGKPPHIFAIADNAYNNLMADKRNQSVVISGESGAGKSEATKLILQYIAEVSSNGQTNQNGLEQQILQSNPLMESFGNAKTVRNNNSSRFGKLITVYFNNDGHIAGGSVISYLLEKSRVVGQAELERNYHIFYQLIAGAESQPELKRRLQLDSPSMFNYLNQSGVEQIEGVSDEADFQSIKLAMDTLGINAEEQMNVWKTVAAVLHLGNIKYNVEVKKDSDDGSSIANLDTLELASSLLELDTDTMNRALTSRNVGSRSVIIKTYTVKEAAGARDALAKAIYSALFDWLMKRINQALSNGQDLKLSNKSMIGVLDIFGFESFVTNSFEQLCINYCNEKLQFHFNEHIFRLEQEVYASEQVVVPATAFKDNRPTLNLLEEKGTGVFSMIDEEINVPKGSDDNFLAKIRTKHGKTESFIVPKAKSVKDDAKCFGIRHYAGEVYYNVTNFLEKNKDTLHGDLINAVQASRSPFLQELFPKPKEEPGAAKNRGRAPIKSSKVTLGAQFKTQLSTLMETLNATFPHFVRCMKPNSEKKGSLFQSEMMLAQLRYAGLLEVCRIRKLGFPIRRDHEIFFKRYRCITANTATDLGALLQRLVTLGHLTEGLWAKGSTKIFMKTEQAQALEAAREASLAAVTTKIQKIARRYITKKRYAAWKKTLVNLAHAIEARTLPELEHWLDMAAELPNRGVHLALFQKGKALKLRIIEELRVISLLEGATSRRDLSGLRAAVEAAQRMDPPFSHKAVTDAKALITRIEEEVAVKTAIVAAIGKRDKSQLQQQLKRAQELGLDCDERSQGKKLLERLVEEEEVMNLLESAIASRQMESLIEVLSRASQMGMETPLVVKGHALKKQLEGEVAVKQSLANAIAQRDLTSLQAALEKAAQVGLDAKTPELVQGKELKALIEKEKSAVAALAAASQTRQVAALDAAIATANNLKLTGLPEYANATAVRDKLVAEDRCREKLRSATAAKSDADLSAALGEAMSLGLTGPEVDAARTASQKLGSQSAVRTEMSVLLNSEDLEAIKAALKKAESQNLINSSEGVSLQQRKKLLEQEQSVLSDIRASMTSNNLKQLAAAVATASAIGADRKFYAEVGSAKEMLSNMQEEAHIKASLQECINTRDSDGIRRIVQRAEALKLTEQVNQAQHSLRQLEDEEQLLEWLSAALEAKDLRRLEEVLTQASRTEIPAEKLKPFRAVVDRERSLKSVHGALVDACQKRDLPVLNKAIEAAIQLGLESKELQEARAMKEELSKLEGVMNEVKAAVDTLKAKAQNELGIKENDLEPIKAVLAKAQAEGVPSAASIMVVAKSLEDKMKKQLVVQAKLKQALESKNADQLIAAVDAAESLDISLEDVRRAKAQIRVQVPLSAGRAANEAPDIDHDAMEKVRNGRRERARNPKFKFQNYTGLRSPDDFAKGIMLNKKKVKENMLRWQSSTINNSLVELSSAHTKLALASHKSLMGYMGDKQMAFPATLAQDILQKGYDIPELRDEIFLQILKQLTGNQKAESIAKGWQLLCMTVSTFPPSAAFQDYLLNYILERESVRGAIRNYARYCCRTLEGMLNTGSTGFVPTVEEISAYKERPPMLATIELVDGTVVSEELPITPDLNVGKVADICAHFLELKDGRASTFGLFVYNVPGEPPGLLPRTDDGPPPPYHELPRTPRPLAANEYMGTILVERVRQRKNYKFVYKRKVFLPQQNGPSDDPMYKHLLYLQLEDEALLTANLRFEDEQQVLTLASISMIVNLGDDYENGDVMEFLPPSWKDVYPAQIWKDKIMNRICEADMQEEVDVLKSKLITTVSTHPLYGAHFFHVLRNSNAPVFVAKLPKQLVFAFNAGGLHIFDQNMKTKLQTYPYADIYKWGGSSSQFSMNLWKAELNTTFELIVTTGQAADMAAIIMDYIQNIMALQQQQPRKK